MPTDIPSGLDHLDMVSTISSMTRRATRSKLGKHEADALMIGTSLSAFYQAATCHRKCHGGGHVLEALTGRMYNLASAAYVLILQGFYDEALNLTRSIGEISNLIALSVVDKHALRQWLSADTNTRIREFSPARVRCLLEKSGDIPVLCDQSWYSEFCEQYTHVNPGTRPNMHNELSQAYVGSVFQSEGLRKALGELATVVGMTAMLICQYFKFDDMFT